MTLFTTTVALGTSATNIGSYVTGGASGAGHTNAGLTQATSIDIQAVSTNTGTVAVGDSAVTATDSGRVLAASGIITLTKQDREVKLTLNDIYLLPSAAGQKVNVTLTL